MLIILSYIEKMKGTLITFEGGEGAGKTTQIQRLIPWLKSYTNERVTILSTREPGGTILGKQIRELLLNPQFEEIQDLTELLLYAADRSQHVEEYLKPHLETGAIVICDRYCDSTIAYQGYGRGFDLNLIQQLNYIATGGLESDLTLWLDVDVETGLKRVNTRGERDHTVPGQNLDRLEKTKLSFHKRVREGFLAIASSYPQRVATINANKSENEVFKEIQNIVKAKVFMDY